MKASLCTLCFSNFGLRREAERIAGVAANSECQKCHMSGGRAIDTSAAETLMHRFFSAGSIPPESGGPAHIYAFNRQHYPGEVEFATELDADVRILSAFIEMGLFHYGPPLWRLGLTEQYQMLRCLGEDTPLTALRRKEVWNHILSRCQIRTLEEGSTVFKVRKGERMPPSVPSEFDTSPVGADGGSRYESDGLRILYAAEDIETCLHESRVTLADWIVVAALAPVRPLRLLDLSEGVDDSTARTPFERVDIFFEKLAFSGREDYPLCQEMAREIQLRGVDGFLFTSYFSQAHHRSLRNVALFGFPVAEGKIRLSSVNRVRLTSASYEYSFGPTNDTTLPIAADEIDAIATTLMEHKDLKRAGEEIRRLVARKSVGPR